MGRVQEPQQRPERTFLCLAGSIFLKGEANAKRRKLQRGAGQPKRDASVHRQVCAPLLSLKFRSHQAAAGSRHGKRQQRFGRHRRKAPETTERVISQTKTFLPKENTHRTQARMRKVPRPQVAEVTSITTGFTPNLAAAWTGPPTYLARSLDVLQRRLSQQDFILSGKLSLQGGESRTFASVRTIIYQQRWAATLE